MKGKKKNPESPFMRCYPNSFESAFPVSCSPSFGNGAGHRLRKLRHANVGFFSTNLQTQSLERVELVPALEMITEDGVVAICALFAISS